LPSLNLLHTLRLGKKLNFVKDLKRAKSKPTSPQTFYTYLSVMIQFGEFVGKEFDKVRKEDIELYQLHLQDSKSRKTGKGLKFKTIEFYSVIIKILYIWYYKTETVPKVVEDIEVINGALEPIKENEVLTPADIMKLIASTSKARNKAILSLLFETGARAGELINANIEDFIN
jgi:integrase